MNRRTFLDAASRAALIASWPAWLQKAFADESKAQTDDDGLTVVSKDSVAPSVPESRFWCWSFRKKQLRQIRARKNLWRIPKPRNQNPARHFSCVKSSVQRCSSSARSSRARAQSDSLMILVETDKLPAEVRRINGKLPEGRSLSRFRIAKSKQRFLRPAKKTGAILGSSRPRASTDRKPRSQKRIDKFAALFGRCGAAKPGCLGKESRPAEHTRRRRSSQRFRKKLQADRDATLSAEELELCAAQIAQYAQSLPSPRKDKLQEQLGSAAEKQAAACARTR